MGEGSHVLESNSNGTGGNDFLELKQQIKLMQEQIQLLISFTKLQAPQFPPPNPIVGWPARH